MTSKTKTAKPAPALVEKQPRPPVAKGRFGTLAGSRKSEVAATLVADGIEAAKQKGAELGLSPVTVTSWVSTWRRKGLWQPRVEKAVRAAKPAKADKV